MRSDGPDQVHVLLRRADVLRGEVTAAETIDEPGVGAYELVGAHRGGVTDDHGLAATEVVPARRVLVRHAAREAQHVEQRIALRRVRPEARAPEARAQRGRVDGDDGSQPGLGISCHRHLLGAVLRDEIEQLGRHHR